MTLFTLSRQKTALLIVDMQDKVLSAVERGHEALQTILKLTKGFQILNLPILLSEQYPQGLSQTALPLRTVLGDTYKPWIKTTFSCMDESAFCQHIEQMPIDQWVVVGIEAHICVLQTAKSLKEAGKQVTVLNDAIASRSIFDYSTAIAEMRDMGVRISCCETVLFELVHDAQAKEFKSISQLVKTC
jgi:nicotinamidase-related amidase